MYEELKWAVGTFLLTIIGGVLSLGKLFQRVTTLEKEKQDLTSRVDEVEKEMREDFKELRTNQDKTIGYLEAIAEHLKIPSPKKD